MSKIATTPTVHKSFTMESNIPTTKVYSSDYDLRTKNSSFRKFLHSPEIKNKHLPEVHAHHRVRRVIDGTDATTGLVPWQVNSFNSELCDTKYLAKKRYQKDLSWK